ncbi:MAG TPA: hypothetical protein VLA04_03760 [Verrucomicrobiae bacterium]|nr:hypothetical protein [Verrucomicrobiae bacterium]
MNIEKLPPLIELKDIMRATMRLPYTESELQAVTNFITYNRGNGLDTQLETTFANYADSLITEGVLIKNCSPRWFWALHQKHLL